jgi:hypothetical protein
MLRLIVLEYAAAFFLLGGSLNDAVNVCVRQLKDFQLAIALARVAERTDDGPVFTDILQNTVIPTAFREGNRWLGSWAFWFLKKRDLALRILIVSILFSPILHITLWKDSSQSSYFGAGILNRNNSRISL